MSELAIDGAQVGRRGGGKAIGKGGSKVAQRIGCTVQLVSRVRSYGMFEKRILLNRREDEPERNVQLLSVSAAKVVSYRLTCEDKAPTYRERALSYWRRNQKKFKCAVSFRKNVIAGYCPPTTFLVLTGEGGISVYIFCKICLQKVCHV
jgi:hypothetical protein